MSNIEIKSIIKNYGKKNVLNDISLTFEEGKIYGLLGRNGAGKTTLLNLITNRVFANSGKVLIDGECVCENDKALSKVYFMTEKDLFPGELKITDIFKWTEEFYEKFDMDYAIKLSKEFELNTRHRYRELSTGFKSIVKIIICLASGAEILIFDEPVLGLDANHRELFYSELLKRYTEKQQTIILSTHIIEEISDMLEKVVIINNGKIIENNYVENLLESSYAVSGKSEVVENYISSRRFIGIETLGAFKKATILEEMTNDDTVIIENGGLEVSKVELQKLFVHLTNKEGK